MTISRTAERTVAVFAGIGLVVGTIKSLAEVAGKINGWHGLAAVCFFILLVVLLDLYRQAMKKKFDDLALWQREVSAKFSERDTKFTEYQSDLGKELKEIKDALKKS